MHRKRNDNINGNEVQEGNIWICALSVNQDKRVHEHMEHGHSKTKKGSRGKNETRASKTTITKTQIGTKLRPRT